MDFHLWKYSKSDIKHFHVVPNLELAQKCVSWGIDGLLVTGNEGGGHQSYENISTLVLLQQVKKVLPNVPIIAAGGYATGEGLASAISMGAGAIAMGSRLMTSIECEFHENVKQAVVRSDASSTRLVQGVFGPIRVLKNNFSDTHKVITTKDESLLNEGDLISEVVHEVNLLEKTYKGDIEEGAVLLGQSIGIIDKIESVSDIIEGIVANAEKCLTEAYNSIKPISLNQIIAC